MEKHYKLMNDFIVQALYHTYLLSFYHPCPQIHFPFLFFKGQRYYCLSINISSLSGCDALGRITITPRYSSNNNFFHKNPIITSVRAAGQGVCFRPGSPTGTTGFCAMSSSAPDMTCQPLHSLLMEEFFKLSMR